MQHIRSVVWRAFARYATVSLESLALWRIALGATCTYVVLRRWSSVELFYTDAGVYPLDALAEFTWELGPLRWVSGAAAAHGVFAFCFCVALAFTAGFGTRVVKWLLLPALVTIHARTPQLATGGEVVLHLQALYAVLLPLGEVLSLDAWLASRRAGKQPDEPYTAVRSTAYPLVLLQLAVIYLFNVMAKSGDRWLDGSAIARSLGAATLVSDLGGWVARAPAPLLRAATYGTLVIEGALPLLLLSPWARRRMHALAAVLIVLLHGGILLVLEVGIFSAAMMCHVPLLLHRRGMEERVWARSPRTHALTALAVLFLLYLGAARLGTDLIVFPRRPRLPLPQMLERVTRAMWLLQPWMMFSPDPPARDFVIVTDAVTRSGRHFDPWRRVASGWEAPLTELPRSVVWSHLFTRYENALSKGVHAPLNPYFARWTLSQGLPAELDGGDASAASVDPVERFDAWFMSISTDPGDVVPADILEERIGVLPLPLTDPLPITVFDAQGVWAPERAADRKIVPEGTHVFTPVSASMSAGCPHLTLDLGKVRVVESAFIQADAADHFLIEGSVDGTTFRLLAEMPAVRGRQHKSRVIALPGAAVRFVRVRPARSRGMRHILSEIALFDRPVALPDLPSRPSERFISSLERPTVVGILSGSNRPSPDCPAEAFSHQ